MAFNFWKEKPKPKIKSRPSKPTPSIPSKITREPRHQLERTAPRERPDNPPRQKPPPRKPREQQSEKGDDPKKEFLRIFKQLTYRHSPWSAWQDFVVMSACSISNAVDKSHFAEREAIYIKATRNYTTAEQELFPQLLAETVMALEYDPEQDFLGGIFMELNLQNNYKAQFFTPYNVSQMMAEIALDDIVSQVEKEGYITINDPCCGAGAMLIAGSNVAKQQLSKANLNFQNHVLVVAQDIDYAVAMMCYIQISLLGMAGYVKVGNSLSEPMVDGDDTKNYWFTPIYFSDVWSTRRLIKQALALFEKGE